MGVAAAWRVDSAVLVTVSCARGRVRGTALGLGSGVKNLGGTGGCLGGESQGKVEQSPRRLGGGVATHSGGALRPCARADLWAAWGLLGLPVLPS